jgi:hypothetical protein
VVRMESVLGGLALSRGRGGVRRVWFVQWDCGVGRGRGGGVGGLLLRGREFVGLRMI